MHTGKKFNSRRICAKMKDRLQRHLPAWRGRVASPHSEVIAGGVQGCGVPWIPAPKLGIDLHGPLGGLVSLFHQTATVGLELVHTHFQDVRAVLQGLLPLLNKVPIGAH